jgi:peptidoglycan/xylan/chitin deacetylase (PgdA/CDA1 family)
MPGFLTCWTTTSCRLRLDVGDELWRRNTPERFWKCHPDPPVECWQAAVSRAVHILELPSPPDDVEHLLALTLGEGQFGPDHWQLSPARKAYYVLKPVVPRGFTNLLKKANWLYTSSRFPLGWPIEDRYVRFQWTVMQQLLTVGGLRSIPLRRFWPHGHRFAFVLTHDIETAKGQTHVRAVADLEERLGFRSSFNFVPERYPLNRALARDLRDRGFEIGIHGLKHDGKLFSSHDRFRRRAGRINAHLKDLGAVGFRSPFTHRHPEWMQALEIEYDLSFFDTDPYEPLPGGGMSIWPFFVGHFVELPYTLPQDCTLVTVMGERTPRVWLKKVGFIARHCGMALVNVHPDYLQDGAAWDIYVEFLQAMKGQSGYWHALPREVAGWWRARAETAAGERLPGAEMGEVVLEDGGIVLR